MTESISEKNLNSLIKKLKTMQATLSPVVLEKNSSGLKSIIVEAFQLCCKFSKIENEDEMLENYTKIYTLLKKIEKETSKSIIIPFLKGVDRKHRIKQLFEWLTNQQIDLSNIELLEHTDQKNMNLGFGLKLTKEMKQGDLIFKIPKNLILTCENFTNNHELSNMIKNDPLLNSMPNILLSIGLIFEFYRKNDSPWKIYLESLPHTFNNICNFEYDDFVILKNSSLFIESLYLWTSCVRQYLYLHLKFIDAINNKNNHILAEFVEKYNLHTKFNIRDYFWAVSTVMTRVNPIPINNKDNQNTLGLVPIMDLCNHIETVYSVDYDTDKNCCSVLSPNDLKIGQELLIFYGARPTSLMFIYNGFYLNNNPNNFVVYKISKNVDLNLFNKKKGLLNIMNLSHSNSHPLSLYTNIWDGELKIIYRILYCQDSEYNTLMKMDNEKLNQTLLSNYGISKESEICALENLKQKLFDILNSYPPSYLLSPSEKNYIRKSCVLFIEQEKNIFMKVIQDIDDILVNIKTIDHY